MQKCQYGNPACAFPLTNAMKFAILVLVLNVRNRKSPFKEIASETKRETEGNKCGDHCPDLHLYDYVSGPERRCWLLADHLRALGDPELDYLLQHAEARCEHWCSDDIRNRCHRPDGNPAIQGKLEPDNSGCDHRNLGWSLPRVMENPWRQVGLDHVGVCWNNCCVSVHSNDVAGSGTQSASRKQFVSSREHSVTKLRGEDKD
jgi:hypothetical protein